MAVDYRRDRRGELMKSELALKETTCAHKDCDQPAVGAVRITADEMDEHSNFTSDDWTWVPACARHIEEERQKHGTTFMMKGSNVIGL
jgi:hypothetical protein